MFPPLHLILSHVLFLYECFELCVLLLQHRLTVLCKRVFHCAVILTFVVYLYTTYLVHLIRVEATNLEENVRAESLRYGPRLAKFLQWLLDILRVGKEWSVV